MVELGLRLVIALVTAVTAYFLPELEFNTIAGTAGFFTVGSLIAFALEKYGKRNSGVAGFIAVFDAMFIASVLANAGQLERYGFLVLAPMLWATGRFGSDAASMAPLVAATVMVSSNYFQNDGFTMPILLHTLGILVLGLLTNQKRVVLRETQVPVTVEKNNYIEIHDEEKDAVTQASIASLRQHVNDLEKNSRRDRVAMRVYTFAQQSHDGFFSAVAQKLNEEVETEGLVIYSFDAYDRRMVPTGNAGVVPPDLVDCAFEIPKGMGDGQIRHMIDKRILALRDPERLVQCATVLLKDRGKFVGMLALFSPSIKSLDESLRLATDASDALGPMVSSELKKTDEQQRLREMETLYGVASVVLGTESPTNLAARVVRELSDTIAVDHIGISFLDGDDTISVANHGGQSRIFDEVSFAFGTGIQGWLKTGSPELYMVDTLADDRLDKTAAMKKRVGSYCMIPLQFGPEPYGFITASTNRVGGIDFGKLKVLRAIAAETSQALGRLVNPSASASGAMTPSEFYGAVREGQNGHLVYLQLLRRDELVEKYGSPAMDYAVRKLLNQLRAKLPNGGAICRRDEGDYVAFLPNWDESSSRSWANDAAATASMVAISTPDGRAKIPLALRAKVAGIGQQLHQVSPEMSA